MFGFVSNTHKTCKFIPAFIFPLICWLKLFIRSLFTLFWRECKQKQTHEKLVAKDYYWIIKFNSGPFFDWQNIKIQTGYKNIFRHVNFKTRKLIEAIFSAVCSAYPHLAIFMKWFLCGKRPCCFFIYCLCERPDKRNKYFRWLDTVRMIHSARILLFCRRPEKSASLRFIKGTFSRLMLTANIGTVNISYE